MTRQRWVSHVHPRRIGRFIAIGGALVAAHMTPLDVHRYRIDRRMRKAFADRPAPSSNEEWAALISEQFKLRAEQGYYAFRGKTS